MKPGAGDSNWWWRDLRRTLCVNRKPDTNLNTLRTYCTMLGLFTTVVLFLRLRSTSLWKTRELSLKWWIQKLSRLTSCPRWHYGCHMYMKWLKDWGNCSALLNLRPFIMGALLDLLKCPSVWTNEDGISRSRSIFSCCKTPGLFIVLANVINQWRRNVKITQKDVTSFLSRLCQLLFWRGEKTP